MLTVVYVFYEDLVISPRTRACNSFRAGQPSYGGPLGFVLLRNYGWKKFIPGECSFLTGGRVPRLSPRGKKITLPYMKPFPDKRRQFFVKSFVSGPRSKSAKKPGEASRASKQEDAFERSKIVTSTLQFCPLDFWGTNFPTDSLTFFNALFSNCPKV